MSDTLYILIVGNPIDGFEFYGPYDNPEGACSDGEGFDAEWVIGSLVSTQRTLPIKEDLAGNNYIEIEI